MSSRQKLLLPAGYTIVFAAAALVFLVLIALDITGIHRTILKAIPVTTHAVFCIAMVWLFYGIDTFSFARHRHREPGGWFGFPACNASRRHHRKNKRSTPGLRIRDTVWRTRNGPPACWGKPCG